MAIRGLEDRLPAATDGAVRSPGTRLSAFQNRAVLPARPSIHKVELQWLLISAFEHQNPAVPLSLDSSESQALCPEWIQSSGHRAQVEAKWSAP